MRIKQFLCITGIHFEKGFVEKYGFVPYTNIHEPLFISGFGRHIYKNLSLIEKHKSLIVLRWAGGDLMWFLKHPVEMERMRRLKNVFHIAISHWLADDLKSVDIPYIFLPVSVYKNDDIKPCPLGDFVYIYKGLDPQYGLEMIRQIHLPDITVVSSESVNDYSREEILKIYEKCFLGLRLTRHDGIANTVCELGLMGRKTIWNGDVPSAIHYNDVEDVRRIIMEEYNNRHNADYNKVAQDVKNYLDIGEEFLNTEFYG